MDDVFQEFEPANLESILQMEIRRDGRVFGWHSVPRTAGSPLLELRIAGTNTCLCQIVPEKHGITSRVYFEVRAFADNDALAERGATFDHLKDAVAWCSANDWLKAPAAKTQQVQSQEKQLEKPPASNGAPAITSLPARTFRPQQSSEIVAVELPPKPAPKPFRPGTDVNHPAHYNMSAIEVIDALEAWNVGPHEFNVIKYVARAEHKGKQLQDLEKALWYLQRKIALLRGVKEATSQELRVAVAEAKPGIYRHYKGGFYRLANVVYHHETRMPHALYKPLNADRSEKPNAEWSARPLLPTVQDLDAWFVLVEVDDKLVPRFMLVESNGAA